MGTKAELVNTRNNTRDKYILDISTNGLKLDPKHLTQNSRSTYPLSSKENEIISVEMKKLLKKLVIVYSTPVEGEFISGVFTRDKKDGNKRMILNLKKLNKFVNYDHIKIESINNVINLIFKKLRSQASCICQGSTNLIFVCTDFCACKMVLRARLCMQDYVFIKQ